MAGFGLMRRSGGFITAACVDVVARTSSMANEIIVPLYIHKKKFNTKPQRKNGHRNTPYIYIYMHKCNYTRRSSILFVQKHKKKRGVSAATCPGRHGTVRTLGRN